MTEQEMLVRWLHEALALLAVEARDHEENKQWETREKRREIAKILRRFIAKASEVLEATVP